MDPIQPASSPIRGSEPVASAFCSSTKLAEAQPTNAPYDMEMIFAKAGKSHN